MGMKKGNLPALIAALAAGASQLEAGRASGLSQSSVQRRLRDPKVVAAVDQARDDMARRATGRIFAIRELAHDRLEESLQPHPSNPVNMRAVEAALRHGGGADLERLIRKMRELEEEGPPRRFQQYWGDMGDAQ